MIPYISEKFSLEERRPGCAGPAVVYGRRAASIGADVLAVQ